MQENIELPEKLIWHSYEYDFIPKSKDWYYIVGIVAFGIVIASVILNNILFAILIIIAAFTIMLFGAREPEEIVCEITSHGVHINKEFYPFVSLSSFFVVTQIKQCIIFKSKKLLSPFIILPAESLDPTLARSFLLKHLTEEEHHIPFAELLSRRLGF